jgi:protocatechuate 3,4-dioxygenase beta subunit
MRLAIIWLCILALVACASAQMAAADPKAPAKASLRGNVIKEPDGEPLKKAIVEVIAENQEEGGNYTATSDQEGHFKITDIQPGRYRIFVERTGYIEVDEKHRRSEGLVISLDAGQELKDPTLRMLAAAVLAGHVLDEDGDPIANVDVTALRRKSSAFEAMGSAHTNDLGEYRIGGLLAGRYYVVASPFPSFQALLPARQVRDDPTPALAYGVTYYPNTADRAQASPIELHAGEEMPVDFSLTRRHSARIGGRVIGLRTGSIAAVMLRSKDGNAMFNGGDSGKDGTFEIPNIAPGSYALTAITVGAETPLIARQNLEVGTADIDDLQLDLLPPATIRGQVHFSGKFAKSDGSQAIVYLHPSEDDDDFFSGVTISGDESAPSPSFAKIKPDGSFELKNVPPGVYELNVSGDAKAFSNAFVESLAVGTKNYVDTGLNISGGIVSVAVTVSAEAGVIEGTVTSEKNQPISDSIVVAVPDTQFRKQASRYQKVSADQTGRFNLRGLRPGTYTLFAWEHLEGDELRDPEFLKPFEGRGTEVKVEKSSHQTVSLKVLAAPADQP